MLSQCFALHSHGSVEPDSLSNRSISRPTTKTGGALPLRLTPSLSEWPEGATTGITKGQFNAPERIVGRIRCAFSLTCLSR